MIWRAEDDDLLRQSWPKRLTCKSIGALMGRSRSAVIGRAHRLGLPRKEIPREAIPKATPKAIPKATPKMPPQAGRCTLMELKNHHCRWPVDNGMFCGGPADLAAGASYCEFHQRIATQRISGSRR